MHRTFLFVLSVLMTTILGCSGFTIRHEHVNIEQAQRNVATYAALSNERAAQFTFASLEDEPIKAPTEASAPVFDEPKVVALDGATIERIAEAVHDKLKPELTKATTQASATSGYTVEFWTADWCALCKEYKGLGYDAEFPSGMFTEVDYEKNKQRAADLQITTLPTIRLLDSSGQQVWRGTGKFRWDYIKSKIPTQATQAGMMYYSTPSTYYTTGLTYEYQTSSPVQRLFFTSPRKGRTRGNQCTCIGCGIN